MARKARQNLPGAVYHVYARGNAKQNIFLSQTDRREYLRKLEEVTTDHAWGCLAYCLMDNHLHLLVETPEPNLSVGMHRLHSHYARWFNRCHDRVGHLFQGRYGAIPVRSERQLQTVAAYIAGNPVEAGFTLNPEDWPWSSYALIVADSAPSWLATPRLLSHFGADPGRAKENLAYLIDVAQSLALAKADAA